MHFGSGRNLFRATQFLNKYILFGLHFERENILSEHEEFLNNINILICNPF